MRKDAAFKFVPELLGNIERVMELSKSPELLYVESAIKTIHAASEVFQMFEEYDNTKRKQETLKAIQKKYNEIDCSRLMNYQDEFIRELDIAFEKVQNKIKDRKIRDQEVCSFIKSIETNLQKILGVFQEIQADPDYPDRTRVEEITRKTLRDYQKILTIHIEEEKNNGED